MLRPSYAELIEILNRDMEADSKITSRYTIVIAASKRARKLIEGQDPLTSALTDKAVSIAVNEMYNRKMRVIFREEEELPPATYTPSYSGDFEELIEEHEYK